MEGKEAGEMGVGNGRVGERMKCDWPDTFLLDVHQQPVVVVTVAAAAAAQVGPLSSTYFLTKGNYFSVFSTLPVMNSAE